jgi:protein-disulfide isomerase
MIHSLPSRLAFFFGFFLATGIIMAAGCVILVAVMLTENIQTTDTPTVNSAASAPVNTEQITSINLSTLRHVQGTGDFTLIEYTDLECPFCKKFHPTVERVLKDYDGRMRYAMKHFPLNIHPKARKEALAAECAGQQNKFFEFVTEIFSVTPSNNGLEENVLFETAAKIGLKEDQFKTCVETESFAQEVADDAIEAQATGGTGTPHTIIIDKDGKIITGIRGSISEQQLRDAIDSVLK